MPKNVRTKACCSTNLHGYSIAVPLQYPVLNLNWNNSNIRDIRFSSDLDSTAFEVVRNAGLWTDYQPLWNKIILEIQYHPWLHHTHSNINSNQFFNFSLMSFQIKSPSRYGSINTSFNGSCTSDGNVSGSVDYLGNDVNNKKYI